MPKKSIDWTEIEKNYKETRTSVAALAKEHGLCHATVSNHMRKHGVTRNPAVALTAALAVPAAVPVDENATQADLAKLRNAVIGRHRVDIARNMRRLELITQRLDADHRLSDMQRLMNIKTIVQIQETLVKLERQAHSITEEAPPPPPPVAFQVNIDLSPEDAYLTLIGRK